MNPYVLFLLYLMAILSFVAITLAMNALLGPKSRPSPIKLEPFECGATPISTLNVKAVPIKYYAVAVVFVLFDLETVFLFVLALGGGRSPASCWSPSCSSSACSSCSCSTSTRHACSRR